jgi:hypothetical protein
MKARDHNIPTRTTGQATEAGAQSFNNPQGFETEIPMSDTAADLHDVWVFFGMSNRGLQAVWDLCQGVDRQYYRQKLAEIADITRTMRRRTNGRTA